MGKFDLWVDLDTFTQKSKEVSKTCGVFQIMGLWQLSYKFFQALCEVMVCLVFSVCCVCVLCVCVLCV